MARIILDLHTWIVMRLHPSLPAGIIRHLEVTDRHTGARVWRYRAVRWAMNPDDRTLIGYYDDIEQADRAIPSTRPIIETSRTDKSFAVYPDHEKGRGPTNASM
jgi:hypothetical protein